MQETVRLTHPGDALNLSAWIHAVPIGDAVRAPTFHRLRYPSRQSGEFCSPSSWVVVASCCENLAVMLDPDQTFALAERVAQIAESLGVKTALIGAAALAVHGYARGTQDIDLATAVPPESRLRELAEAIGQAGIANRLSLPDDDDPLGGVIRLWASDDEHGNPQNVVEVVNFFNPMHLVRNPGPQALARATLLDGTKLRCATLPDLVALKLYAGGRSDLADIVQLLAHAPVLDVDEIRIAAGPYDRTEVLEELIAEASELRR